MSYRATHWLSVVRIKVSSSVESLSVNPGVVIRFDLGRTSLVPPKKSDYSRIGRMTDLLLSSCIFGDLDGAKYFVEERIVRSPVENRNGDDRDAGYPDNHSALLRLGDVLNCDYAYRRGRYSPLAIASLNGHIDVVRFLLEHGADVHRLCGRKKYTVLGMAARNGHSQIVQTLLEAGCDPNAPTYAYGKTCLFVATANNYFHVVRILLQAGADVHHSMNKLILHEACWRGHLEVVHLLIERGADVNHPNSEGYSPLLAAAEGGHLEIVKLLIEHKANVNACDLHHRDTALHKAVELGCLEMFQSLLGAGAAVLAVNGNRETPFNMAILNSQEDMVRRMILARPESIRGHCGNSGLHKENKSSFDNLHQCSSDDDCSRNSFCGDGSSNCSCSFEWEGEGPVHCAVRSGNLEIVKMLVQDGANVMQIDDRQRTPLHYACYSGNVDAAEVLLKWNARLDPKNSNGMTPLHLAVQEGHIELVRLFLRHQRLIDVRRPIPVDGKKSSSDSIVNLLDNHERTPLHLAASLGRLDMVTLMLQRQDAILDLMDRWRRTPLHVATEAGNMKIVHLLLKHNSDVLNQVDKTGFTPLHKACECGRMEMIRIFLDSGAKVDSADFKGSAPLHIACRIRNLDVVKLLLANDASVDQTDCRGRTPLHICSEFGHIDILKTLLRHCHRVDLPDLNGWTPLALASVKGDPNVVNLLIEMHLAGDRAGVLHIRQLLLGH